MKGTVKERCTETPGGCWEWCGSRHGNGYGHVRHGGRVEKAHRAAWMTEVGPIPPGMQVLHRCDNPPCCNPSHLFLGTNAENVADKVSKGRQHISPRGEDNYNCRHSDAAVAMVRALRAARWLHQDIADATGVSKAHVGRILRGETRG